MRATLILTAIIALLAAPAGANDVGVNAHVPTDDQLDALADLGVEWVRVDANWFQLEPAAGRYDWGYMDRVVDGASARGLKVMMTLSYAPAWATDGGADDVPSNDVPRAGTYAAFVEAAVTHYAARGVRHFGIWNEPNLDHFWEGTLDQYVDRVLRPGADAVRRACADCKVLGPDIASVGPWQDYLGGVLDRAGDVFDILTHHTYAQPQAIRARWICDDLAHAIDIGDDAICFYEPGLRQVLDGAAWQGEVWLTEVGYRADPWDDADEQQNQVIYAREVLALQLATPWWTNTFFYELTDCRPAQPTCDIDGYGLTRRVAGPDATWADNFVLKPVFAWLKAELAENPAWREDAMPPPPPPPPPAAAIEAPRRMDAAPDGSLGEWDDDGCVVLTRYEVVDQPRAGDADLSARACAAWSAGALWLSVDVEDERHRNDQPDDTLWLGDSVQLAVDLDADGGDAYDDDDREVTVALVGDATRLHAFHGGLDGITAAVARDGRRTRYELRVAVPGLGEGDVVKASFLINDADAAGRDGWLEWTPGIGRTKTPGDFGTVTLVGREAMADPDMGLPRADDAGRPPPPLPDPPDVGAPTGDAGADGGMTRDDAGRTDAAPGGARADAGPGGTPPALDVGVAVRADGGAAATGGGDEGCVAAPGGAPWVGLGLLLLGLRRRRRR